MTRAVGGLGRAATIAITVLGSPAPASAEDCLPLEPRSAPRAAERVGLDEEQERWLLIRLAEGRIDDPGDLADMPGAGGELEDDLASLFCWEPRWGGGVTVAGRRTRSAARAETRFHWGRGSIEAGGRWQGRSDGGSPARIGIEASGHAWEGCAGHLASRYGLGLAVGLPPSRGGGPLRASRGEWHPSRSADPDLPGGMALAVERGGWRGSGFTGGFPDRTWGSVLALEFWRVEASAGGMLAFRGGEAVGALHAAGRGGDACSWALEGARGARGGILGGAWRWIRGFWRLEASLVHRGPGYRSPLASLLDSGGDADGAALLTLGLRRLDRGGGFVRLGILESRRPDRDWGIARRAVEVELGRSLARGVQSVFLARTRRDGVDGGGGKGSRDHDLRAEIRARSGAKRWRVRVEERLAEDRLARWVTLSWGGGGDRFRWEVRGGWVRLDPGAEGFAWYRRRAGGLYAWDRIGEGSALGMWGRLSSGWRTVEVSLDGGPSGWEGTMGVALALGRSP